MLLAKDAQLGEPVLDGLLRLWYPASPFETQDGKQALLENFLTEKEQFSPEYQKIRDIRLHALLDRKAGPPSHPCGIEAVRLGLLDFLDLIAAYPTPQRFYLVFTEDQVIYFSDEGFSNLYVDKLMRLFEAGHRLSVAIRSDRVAADILHFRKAKLYAHLKGYITTRYYEDYRPSSDKILGIVGDQL
ncbi:MAG: hypothetical protein FWD72_02900, partial [Eggerthellaceae bacterium]|nr:hypothetical protein [Eggerthellaceae bacterium]